MFRGNKNIEDLSFFDGMFDNLTNLRTLWLNFVDNNITDTSIEVLTTIP